MWTKVRNCTISHLGLKRKLYSLIISRKLFWGQNSWSSGKFQTHRADIRVKTKGNLLTWQHWYIILPSVTVTFFTHLRCFHIFISSASLVMYPPKPTHAFFSFTAEVYLKLFFSKNFKLCSFLWHLFGIFKVNQSCLTHKWKQNSLRLELAVLQIIDFAQEKPGSLFATKMIFIGIICSVSITWHMYLTTTKKPQQTYCSGITALLKRKQS